MSLVKTNAQACVKCNDIKSSQCVINSQINTHTKRGGYPLINQSNATFASIYVQAWPSKRSLVESPFCGPRISAHALPARWRARFLFRKMIFIDYLKMTWICHLFLFYFLKSKQNKKENPKCDSLFGKGDLQKTRSSSGVRLLIEKVR